VGLIHRRQKPLTPTVSRFIQLLKDANEEPIASPRARDDPPAAPLPGPRRSVRIGAGR
jgi:hypothetical protein